LADRRPPRGGRRWFFPLIQASRHKGRPNKAVYEKVAGIDGDRIDGTGPEGFLANPLDVLALTEVDREGNHIQVVFLADPRHHDRGVQTATIGKNDFIPGHGSPALPWLTMRERTHNRKRQPVEPLLPRTFAVDVRAHTRRFLPHRKSPLASKGLPNLSMPFRLQIPLAIYDQMIAQARAELP